MGASNRLRRIVAAGVLALSTAVAAFVPLADAMAEARAGAGTAHVEAPNANDCKPAHDHDACQMCRTLRLAAAPNPAGATQVTHRDPAVPVPDAVDVFSVARLHASAAPRAPPSRPVV
jgi:hypothetical protein